MNTPPDSEFNAPRSSFMTPVLPPSSEPDEGGLVCVQFNEDWLPYVLGCLWQLLQPTTWLSDDPLVIRLAQDRASNLIYLFTLASTNICGGVQSSSGGELLDMAFTKFDDDKSHLDFEISPGVWIPLANLTDVPAANQPGAGSPQPTPGGGNVAGCILLPASGQALLPAPVSSGDQILITSADGATNDGTLIEWFCPNGQFYFAGLCSGSAPLDVSDPVPTQLHMSIVLKINSTYYPIAIGTPFTAPGGISLQNAVFVVNGHTPSVSSGSYGVCFTQTNNQTLTFSHTFDFTLSDGGWVKGTSSCGDDAVYVPGTGWEGRVCATVENYLIFLRTFPSRTILSVEAFYSLSGHAATGGAAIEYNLGLLSYGALDGSIGVHDTLISNTVAGVTQLEFGLADAGSGISFSWICAKIIVTGQGSDPF